MTEQEFKKKYVGKAVHCDTEEKAKELLKLAHDFGWKWPEGESLIGDTFWCPRKKYTCYHFKNDKTTVTSALSFYEYKGYEIVKFESEEKKMKMTKKVFDLGLFVDERREDKRSDEVIMRLIKLWALECHGLTEEEINKKNYFIIPSWMKEVEVDMQLTPHEVEVLKGLKVLGFDWIARDEDNSLNAYYSKPRKKESYFDVSEDYSSYLEIDLFLFKSITWQDEEATKIDELLKNV